MKFETITAPTITELFEKQIQSSVLSGKLAIGEHLPTERELSESMKISKSIVHLGIKNLERKGFLRTSPRHGIYVADYIETGNVETLLALLKFNDGRLDKQMIISILQFREAIEGMAMRLFASNHTKDDITLLRDRVNSIRECSGRIPGAEADEIAELVCKYHVSLCVRSGNTITPLVFNAFHDVIIVFWTNWVRQVGPENTIKLLEKYTDCLESGDGEGAIKLFRKHADEYLERV